MPRLRMHTQYSTGRIGSTPEAVSKKSAQAEKKLPPTGRTCDRCGGPVSRYAKKPVCSRCLERGTDRDRR